MRVAVLNDIHGNIDALDAVLAEVRRESVDRIVVGGDVLPGPIPRESFDRLLELDLPVQFIHGNGDRVVLAEMTGGDISEVPEPFRDCIRWTAAQLDSGHQRALAAWPLTCHVAIDGLGDVLFCHATIRNDRDIFMQTTPDDLVARVFAGVSSPLVVCGHTHLQFERTIGKLRIVNAGSVGMPFAKPAGAHWLMLGPDVQFRQTAYDFDKAVARIRQSGYPRAETLSVRYVLDPPSEAETLQMYAQAQVKA